jgi:SAM-dependent methyltransferase
MGRWSRLVAPRFLSWLGVPAAQRWLDVGCGTGALSAALLECCAPASVMGVDPSDAFLDSARTRFSGRVELRRAAADHLPLDGGGVDATASGLVLNFVPDALASLGEMARVTVDGGTIAAYVWDYAAKMELVRCFWDAAIALDPEASKLDEAVRFPLCRPEALVELFTRAGLGQVEVAAIDIPTRFVDFEDCWRPFLGGQGPAPTYVMTLGETARIRLRERFRAHIPVQADGSIALTARAWAVRALRKAMPG